MNSKVIFCIIGMTGSGKSSLVDILLNHDPFNYNLELKKLVYSTTRNKRQNEEDGVEYNFKTEEKMNSEASDIVECRTYDTRNDGVVHYYTTKNEIESDLPLICAASTDQLNSYVEAGYDVRIIKIDTSIYTRLNRVLSRSDKQDNTCLELCRRILDENREFSNSNKYSTQDNTIIIKNDYESTTNSFIDLDGRKYDISELKSVYDFIAKNV